VRATILARAGDGSWRVHYYRDPNLDQPARRVTEHAFRWQARLASWLFMNGWREGL